MQSHSGFSFWPDSASTVAGRVDALVWFLLAVCGLVTLLIAVLIVGFVLRFRRGSENEIPAETRPHLWMEIAWTVIPFGLMLVMFVWGSALYVYVRRPPRSALGINVVAKQWMWKLQHPDGQREINELHVPTGRPIKLVMTSQDVIHDLFVPAFRIKQDVLPGTFTTLWFEAQNPGEYHLFCAEYCGTSHSQMTGRIIVMSPADYASWLAGTAPDETPAAGGSRLFVKYGCGQCHGQTAPTLAGLFGRRVQLSDGASVIADEQYLRESILNPPSQLVAGYSALMPSYRGQLTEEQLADLIAYIKTLGGAATTRPGPPRLQPDQLRNMPPAQQQTGGAQ